MINSSINGIFPTPIYISKLNRVLSESELLFIDETKLDTYNNEGNTTSNNNYILNNKIFKELKKELDLRVQDYFDKIICPANNITPYITQSWLNYTETNQYHHKHEHPNSLISGVFYYGETDSSTPAIKFHKPIFGANASYMAPQYQADRRPSEYAWETFAINHAPGLLILFPSYMLHSVPTNESKFTRKSLAFNVQPKGSLGYRNNLTELLFHKVM
jgi:uncharacterized protein (TIGR02466 family)